MCGIVGYVGNKQVVPVILEGLRKLEYRGYDSAGIAVVDEGHQLDIRRAEGKLRNLEEAIRLKPLDGTYGIGHTRWATHGRPTEENAHPHRDCTGRVVVVHIGLGDGEYFVASDIPPILQHTRDVFFLGDGEIAVLTRDAVRVTDFDGDIREPAQQRITWDPIMAEKGGFKHFMLKEIFEQPRAVRDTVQGRVSLDTGRVYLEQMNVTEAEFRQFDRVMIAACGTSWHAGLAGKYMVEQLARVPVEVDYASEFRYRDPVINERTLLIVISQSGETADTIAALREAKERGSKVLAICNVQGSMITRESDGTILTHAGPEIGVASTKAFTAQMVALYLLGLYLGQLRGVLTPDEARRHAQQLAELPVKIEHL